MQCLPRAGWMVTLSVTALAPLAAETGEARKAERSPSPAKCVPAAQRDVQPLIDQHLAAAQEQALKEVRRGKDIAGLYKHPARLKSTSDAWGALADLEAQGLQAAELARGGLANLHPLVSALLQKPVNATQPPRIADLDRAGLREHVAFMLATIARAEHHRELALKKLSAEDKRFLFDHGPALLASFGPQLPFNERTKPVLEADRRFCTLAQEQVDWVEMLAAFQHVAVLVDPAYLAGLQKALDAAPPIQDSVPGVTGDILYRAETPEGLVIIGGKGDNHYELKSAVALLIDLGGDDHYKGVIASSFDADHAISLVIDFAGDDAYEPNELGLATGRLGFGMLLDLAGKDIYHLKTGSGGVGLCGVGILCEAAGDDTYLGSKYTQGVGFAGLGLLLDLAGKDTHTSQAFAIGLGGTAGVGAVIDVAGDDSYQCGKHLPSGYNQSDAPTAKPGDANFQYDAWGIGMGLGRRIWPPSPESDPFALAGGVGMVLDLSGDDRYESSNFSQACGYFFGIGVKLDLEGDDIHLAARYGHASGAHYGMGLFIDYRGQDRYETTGPTYNGGCSWDRSIFLCIDAAGDDEYRLERSSGPGLADIGSWGVFADLAGKDRYEARHGLGRASRDGLAVFFDKSGDDDYSKAPKHGLGGIQQPANGLRMTDGAGGMFVDR